MPICFFCYHKVGTVLLSLVFRDICDANGWNFKVLMGRQEKLPRNADVVIIAHSLLDPRFIREPVLGVHLIRDPRDIIVSGYLYHRRTEEKWCINTDFDNAPPILFPKVPYSQQHRSEEWKAMYLASLNSKSYQQNLLEKNQHDGLMFEMEHYGAWTIEMMAVWDYGQKNILEIRFEALMKNYEKTFYEIFKHLGFTGSMLNQALQVAARHDLGRKSDAQLKEIKHVSSRSTTKWQKYFEKRHKEVFYEKFGNILIDLEYEESNQW